VPFVPNLGQQSISTKIGWRLGRRKLRTINGRWHDSVLPVSVSAAGLQKTANKNIYQSRAMVSTDHQRPQSL
jgi:hypothetical protein